MCENPTDILKTYLNENICAGARNGEFFEGKLVGFDEYNNILIIKDKIAKFIRGEMIVFIGQKCTSKGE